MRREREDALEEDGRRDVHSARAGKLDLELEVGRDGRAAVALADGDGLEELLAVDADGRSGEVGEARARGVGRLGRAGLVVEGLRAERVVREGQLGSGRRRRGGMERRRRTSWPSMRA